LLNDAELNKPWADWWQQTSSESFYAQDLYVLSPAELNLKRKNTTN